MDVFKTFSKRRKERGRAGQPVPLTLGPLPAPFRHQVMYLVSDAIGRYGNGIFHTPHVAESVGIWDSVYNHAVREFGKGELVPLYRARDRKEQCIAFLESGDTDEALDLIELAFHAVNVDVRALQPREWFNSEVKIPPDDAIAQLNERFREHDLAYQFADGQLLEVSSQYLHTEAVEPALTLLHAEGFTGPEQEFLRAHKHFRHGDYHAAIVDANNAFESTMKAICDKRHWKYEKADPANKLITAILEHELVPKFFQDQLSGLRNLLIGLPTVRNKTSGHGQGAEPVEVPEYLAAYALHMAASNIVLLVQAYKALTYIV